jgi:hypothetical protein
MRQGLENELHWDLGEIRIHSGEQASRYTAVFGAAAYTVGNHIVLGDRRQRAGLDDTELLIHEATHAVQQLRGGANWMESALRIAGWADRSEVEARGGIARRPGHRPVTPTRAGVALTKPKNPQIVYSIRDHWARRRQISRLALNPPPSKDPKHRENRKDNHYHAMQCINRIRALASRQKLPAGKTEEDYYKILEKLLKTPKAKNTSPDLKAERRDLEIESLLPAPGKRTEEQLTASLRRNRLPNGQRVQVLGRRKEVNQSRTKARFTVFLYRKPGEKTWYKRAHIHARIYLEAARKPGKGGAQDKRVIKQLKAIVQDIENTAAGSSRSGVTFDLEFATKKRGAARFKIDTSKWTTSANPWGSARTMVEELFHNIGLEDLYDYTSHATNAAMSIHDRLEGLLDQFKKYRGTDPKWRPELPSITKRASSPTDFDYCQVLAVNPAQFRRCLKERGVKAAKP